MAKREREVKVKRNRIKEYETHLDPSINLKGSVNAENKQDVQICDKLESYLHFTRGMAEYICHFMCILIKT